jgi:kynurenine formamidase
VTTVPAYRDLPILIEGTDYRCAWDHFPPGDDLGCLRHITPARRRRALAGVTTGETVNLSLPLTLPDPPMFGRESLRHEVFVSGRNNVDDRLDNFFPQASSQWDGFRHVRAREHGFFTGHPGDFQPGPGRLGIEHFAEQGIIGRGVLLDLSAAYLEAIASGRGDEDCWFDATDLRNAAAAASVEVQPGDVLCLRTGWMHRYLAAGPEERVELGTAHRWPGLAGSAGVAEVLWDWQVAAVVGDNPAVEMAPGRREFGSLHRRVVPLLGIPLGELFTLEDLAVMCARTGRRHFAFVSVPLNLPGGVGSPANAVAIF